MSSEVKLKCVWDMGREECSDDIKKVPWFKNQGKIPVCSSHIKSHKRVMDLYNQGYDIEDILCNEMYKEKESVE